MRYFPYIVSIITIIVLSVAIYTTDNQYVWIGFVFFGIWVTFFSFLKRKEYHDHRDNTHS